MIRALSRFDETPSELVIELRDGEYQSLGSEQDVKTQEARTMILEILPTNEGEALAMDKLQEALKAAKVGRTTVHQVVSEYVQSQTVIRIGAGKRGDPYKYWRPKEKLAAGTPVVPAESNGAGGPPGEKVSAALKGEVPAESNGDPAEEYEEALL